MQNKRKPMRMCIGCREMKPKEELIRVVKKTTENETSNTSEIEISLDFTGKKPGRGAYICTKMSCFEGVKKNRKLEKHLKCRIPQNIYELVEEELRRLAE